MTNMFKIIEKKIEKKELKGRISPRKQNIIENFKKDPE